jgi:hypothetical protein
VPELAASRQQDQRPTRASIYRAVSGDDLNGKLCRHWASSSQMSGNEISRNYVWRIANETAAETTPLMIRRPYG